MFLQSTSPLLDQKVQWSFLLYFQYLILYVHNGDVFSEFLISFVIKLYQACGELKPVHLTLKILL